MEIRVIGIKAVKVNREMTVRPEQTTDLVREIISVLLECQISARDDYFLKKWWQVYQKMTNACQCCQKYLLTNQKTEPKS